MPEPPAAPAVAGVLHAVGELFLGGARADAADVRSRRQQLPAVCDRRRLARGPGCGGAGPLAAMQVSKATTEPELPFDESPPWVSTATTSATTAITGTSVPTISRAGEVVFGSSRRRGHQAGSENFGSIRRSLSHLRLESEGCGPGRPSRRSSSRRRPVPAAPAVGLNVGRRQRLDRDQPGVQRAVEIVRLEREDLGRVEVEIGGMRLPHELQIATMPRTAIAAMTRARMPSLVSPRSSANAPASTSSKSAIRSRCSACSAGFEPTILGMSRRMPAYGASTPGSTSRTQTSSARPHNPL